MSLNTFSTFFYGQTIDGENYLLDLDEGVGEISATLKIGSYSLTDLMVEIKRALDSVGTQTYSVTLDRPSRKITIFATNPFKILTGTGSHRGTTGWTLLGFNGADKISSSTYTADSNCGLSYNPQFILQDHIDSEDFQQAVDAVVNKSASGKLEVVRFGVEKFVQMKIQFATNIIQGGVGNPIHSNPTGVQDLRTFMKYLVTKAPVEFMADTNDLNTFQTLILDTLPESQTGTGYKLKELYDRKLPGYYETSVLKMRVIE